MLIASVEIMGIPVDVFINLGIASAICFAGLALTIWIVVTWWKVRLPLVAKKEQTQIKLQETLTKNSTTQTQNSERQTEILDCLKETMESHTRQCGEQANREVRQLEVLQQTVEGNQNITERIDDVVKQVHEDLENFRADHKDPNQPYATVHLTDAFRQSVIAFKEIFIQMEENPQRHQMIQLHADRILDLLENR